MDSLLLTTRLVWLCWIAWLALWIVLARGTKPTRRRESPLSRGLHLIPVLLGGLLLANDTGLAVLDQPIMPRVPGTALSAAWLVLTGLGFAVWARLVIARNWSGTVTLKEDHELVRAGPYGMVRHPIYSGLLLALFGTVLVVDAPRGVIGFLLILAAFLVKIRVEEGFMAEAFGPEYAEYRAKVPALLPRLFA